MITDLKISPLTPTKIVASAEALETSRNQSTKRTMRGELNQITCRRSRDRHTKKECGVCGRTRQWKEGEI